MPKKIWIDAGHEEKKDSFTYALELDRQFRAQGFATVLTRDLDVRTAMERKAECDLAISCHSNGAIVLIVDGFEVWWLHHAATKSYVQWARDIVDGIRVTSMKIHLNSGTNSPSSLIELGFMASAKDNALFEAKYKEMCAAIVKASCRFLGEAYKVVGVQCEAPRVKHGWLKWHDTCEFAD